MFINFIFVIAKTFEYPSECLAQHYELQIQKVLTGNTTSEVLQLFSEDDRNDHNLKLDTPLMSTSVSQKLSDLSTNEDGNPGGDCLCETLQCETLQYSVSTRFLSFFCIFLNLLALVYCNLFDLIFTLKSQFSSSFNVYFNFSFLSKMTLSCTSISFYQQCPINQN